MMKTYVLIISCLSVLLLCNAVNADETQEIVRARIGIELRVGETSRQAQEFVRVKAGDTYRIYLFPEPEPGYGYAVYTDDDGAFLLNEPEHIEIPKDLVLVLPSSQSAYSFDNSSPMVMVTIICSATRLSELETLFQQEGKKGECPVSQWRALEAKLIEQGKIDLSKIPGKPWPLAGTIRDAEDEKTLAPVDYQSIHDFLEKLKISSGKFWVVKKYEFRITK
jgi:hypothetical protein